MVKPFSNMRFAANSFKDFGYNLQRTLPGEYYHWHVDAGPGMQFNVNGKIIETDEQGFLRDLDDWNEDFARALAQRDGVELYVDHWELIWYFRDYYEETQSLPTMRKMVLELGKHRGPHFRDRKAYEKHIYSLFPTDPLHEICKLAGLPMPQPDT